MKCVICKHGDAKEGTTTVTFDRNGMTLVVKDVPARICTTVVRITSMNRLPTKFLPSQNA